jgi:hypothetical protein
MTARLTIAALLHCTRPPFAVHATLLRSACNPSVQCMQALCTAYATLPHSMQAFCTACNPPLHGCKVHECRHTGSPVQGSHGLAKGRLRERALMRSMHQQRLAACGGPAARDTAAAQVRATGRAERLVGSAHLAQQARLLGRLVLGAVLEQQLEHGLRQVLVRCLCEAVQRRGHLSRHTAQAHAALSSSLTPSPARTLTPTTLRSASVHLHGLLWHCSCHALHLTGRHRHGRMERRKHGKTAP